MRTIAILPVKTFGASKQRLSKLLGGGSRQALARAMFSDVLSALRHVPALDEVAVVTSDGSAEWAARAERVLVLTGAGVSAESGVPTFRGAGGLWRDYRAEELATPGAFARDPRLVWEWYGWRRAKVAKSVSISATSRWKRVRSG